MDHENGDSLLIGEERKKCYVLIRLFQIRFDTFMYHHTLHSGRKHFYSYCLQTFTTSEKY